VLPRVTTALNHGRPAAAALDTTVNLSYVNVRGIRANVGQIRELVRAGSVTSTLLGVGEHMLRTRSVALCSIAGYGWDAHCDLSGKRPSGGVGVWSSSAAADAGSLEVLDGDSSRRIWCRLLGVGAGKRRDTFVVFCYAPVAARGDGVDSFWDELAREVLEFQHRGDVVVMGDLNARVGTKSGDLAGSRNHNGERLQHFMAATQMVMINGTRKCEGRFTRVSGASHSVLDYVLVSSAAVDRVVCMKVESFAIGSDHRMITLRWSRRRVGHARTVPPVRYVHRLPPGTSRMHPDEPDTWAPFRECVDVEMERWKRSVPVCGAGVVSLECVDKVWVDFRGALARAAAGSLGSRRVGARRPLGAQRVSSPALRECYHRRNALYARLVRAVDESGHGDASLWSEFEFVNKEFRSILRPLQRASRERVFKHLEGLQDGGDARKFWSTLTRMRAAARGTAPIPLRMHDSAGKGAASDEESIRLWRNCFDATSAHNPYDRRFHPPFCAAVHNQVEQEREHQAAAAAAAPAAAAPAGFAPATSADDPDALNRDVELGEVAAAIGQLRARKATGDDGLPTEFFLCGGIALTEAVHVLFRFLWRARRVPTEWLSASLIPIHKSGSRFVCGNYRAIALTSVVAKLYERVLADRINAHLAHTHGLPPEQGGFRRGRGVQDQAFTLSEIIALRRDCGEPTWLAFLDVSRAYDTTWRDGMWVRCKEVGIVGHMLAVVMDFYRDVRSRVHVNGMYSDWFSSVTGVRQGSVLSPLLFSIFINGLVTKLNRMGLGVRVLGVRGVERRVCCLLFADDIVLVAESEAELRKALSVCEEYAREWRFAFNAEKSGVMRCSVRAERSAPARRWMIGGAEVAETDYYKYLGYDFQNRTGTWKRHCARRATAAMRTMGALSEVGVHQGGLRVKTGAHLARAIVLPVLEYGAEFMRPDVGARGALERVMSRIMRIITGASSRASTAALRGELAWRSVEERWEVLRCRYFHRLRNMGEDSIARWVFVDRMRTAVNLRAPASVERMHKYGQREYSSWCVDVCRSFIKLGISLDEWTSEPSSRSAAAWRKLVELRATDAHDRAWRASLVTSEHGRDYLAMRWNHDGVSVSAGGGAGAVAFAPQKYLVKDGSGGASRFGARWKLRMRVSDFLLPLRAFEERWRKPSVSASCVLCSTPTSREDRAHLLLNCSYYAELRALFFARVDVILSEDGGATWRAWDDARRVRLLLGDERLDAAVKQFLSGAFAARRQAMSVREQRQRLHALALARLAERRTADSRRRLRAIAGGVDSASVLSPLGSAATVRRSARLLAAEHSQATLRVTTAPPAAGDCRPEHGLRFRVAAPLRRARARA